MEVRISSPTIQIPQVVHGVSANTLHYLMKKTDGINGFNYLSELCGHNKTSLSMPYDMDDLKRCVMAYHAFDWKFEDFVRAKLNCKKLELAAHWTEFLDNFEKVVELFKSDKDKCESLMSKIFPGGFFKDK